jgi:filamentous hemagglutinin family protein
MNRSQIFRPSISKVNGRRRQTAALMFTALFLVQQMQASGPTMPSAGSFAAGSGTIASSANALIINQSSARGIINWNSFSIGKGGTVTFNNGSGATLNRVTGADMSSILGNLISSGSVYLINPQGILIGPGAHVNTGGDFVASTSNIANSDFLSGNSFLFKGNSQAVVANLGSIFSKDGSIFLIGHEVTNSGKLSASNGSVGLGAGSEVLLKDSTSDQRVFVQGPGGDVTNTGTISAAAIELKAKGGNIYALAGNDGGQISATGTTKINGQVWLIADDGKTTVSGTVSAKNADGNAGNVETSGKYLDISHATVKTGQGGNWLLDPVDLTIDSSAANTIQNSLATTNVTVSTSATGSSGPGTTASGSGDINVNNSIAWNSGNSLTLSAYRNINVNDGVTISNAGAGNLTLYADNAATGTGTVNFAGSGNVDFTGSGNINLYYHPSAYPTATDFSSVVTTGTGTFTPFMTVDSMADLQNINLALTSNYALNTDLDASSTPSFTPLGESWSPSFQGIFDGQGHSIDHLTITGNLANMGLFGVNFGTIKNINLTHETVSGGSSSTDVGGLAGQNERSISNSSVSGNITGSAQYGAVGGLVGLNSCCAGSTDIESSSSSGSVTNSGNLGETGGLAGASYSTINNSYSTADVTSSAATSGTGGLVGSTGGAVSNSYAAGTVSGSGSSIGGFAGYGYSPTFANDYWVTDVTGQTAFGYSSGSRAGLSGITTAALQNGSLPSGFDGSVWAAAAGHFPYLSWQGVPLSGTVYDDGSPLASATVAALVGGNVLGSATTNGAGAYSIVAPPNTLVSGTGVLAYLTSGGTGNTFSDGNCSCSYSNLNIYTDTLTLLNTSNSTYSGLINALNTALGSQSGSNFLFNVQAGNLNLKSGTNFFLDSYASGLTIDQPVSATGGVLIQSEGNLSLASGATIAASGSGTALTLVSGGAFTNGAGANALSVSGGGRWLVYSQNPANDNRGGLAYDFKQYNAVHGSSSPAQASGNGFLYTLAPVVSASLTGTANKTYDGSNSAALSSSNYQSSGTVDGDTVAFNNPTTGIYSDSKNAGTDKAVTATGLTIASASNGSAPVYGYQLSSTSASGDIGTITSAQLLYTASTGVTRRYGAANPSFSGTVTGFQGSDTLGSATTGTAVFASPATAASNAGAYAINGSGLTLTTGNYTLAQASGNSSALAINPITISIGSFSRHSNQSNPTFTASYAGTTSDYLKSLLSSLTLVTNAPANNTPGVYQVTAVLPAGLASDVIVQPGTLTITANSVPVPGAPGVLPTFPTALPASMQTITPAAACPFAMSAASYDLLPANAGCTFQIIIAPSQNSGATFQESAGRGAVLSQASFTETSPDGHTTDKQSTYAAGTRP